MALKFLKTLAKGVKEFFSKSPTEPLPIELHENLATPPPRIGSQSGYIYEVDGRWEFTDIDNPPQISKPLPANLKVGIKSSIPLSADDIERLTVEQLSDILDKYIESASPDSLDDIIVESVSILSAKAYNQ